MSPERDSPYLDPYIALAIMALAVSFSAILIKLCQAPPLAIAFWRLALGTALVLPFGLPGLWRGRGQIEQRDLLWAVSAGLLLGLHLWSWIVSLTLTTLAASMFLLTTQLIMGVVLSHVLLKESADRKVMRSMALALLGATAIGLRHAQLGGGSMFGDLLALVSAFLYVLYIIVGRRARPSFPIMPYLVLVYATAALTMLLAALLTQQQLSGFGRETWLLFVALAVLPTVFGHGMANYAVRYVRAYLINLVLLSEPVLTLMWAALLWRQSPSWVELFGGGLIMTGGWLAIQIERRRQKGVH